MANVVFVFIYTRREPHTEGFFPVEVHRLMSVDSRSTLTVWDCRFWLASITAVRGTVSSSSSLPGAGFSRKDIPED